MSQNRIENMPGGRAEARAFVVFLCCLVALAVVGCATRPFTVKPDDPLYGTWINEEKDKEGGGAKIILFPDGRESAYPHIADVQPAYEGRYTMEESWIDRQGNRWYKRKGTFWPHAGGTATEEYELIRINREGTVMEWATAGYGYPDKVEPVNSPNYRIWYRGK